MTNAKRILDLAIASIDTSNPENFKWATCGAGTGGRPSLDVIVAAVAYEVICEALESSDLTRQEQREIRNQIKGLVDENSYKYSPGMYLMKNEIAAIRKITLDNI